jgi:hypothetical protein
METRVEVRFLENDRFEVTIPQTEVRFYVDKKKEGYVSGDADPLELFDLPPKKWTL